jgi:hypothetical protein
MLSRRSAYTVLLVSLACSSTPPPPPSPALVAAEPASGAGLAVQASIATAGPYGEFWTLSLAPDGTAFLHVSYSLDPAVTLLANFALTPPQLESIQAQVELQDFFHLPTELSDPEVALHQPDLRLTVSLGGQSHRVTLYDPEDLGAGNRQVQRFLAVWRVLFEALPLAPEW